jgi:hypothetical protein
MVARARDARGRLTGATPERFELPTVSLGRTCSIQLSYGALARAKC